MFGKGTNEKPLICYTDLGKAVNHEIYENSVPLPKPPLGVQSVKRHNVFGVKLKSTVNKAVPKKDVSESVYGNESELKVIL